MNYILNHVRLDKLTSHPLSITLYGYDLDRRFIASVRQHGIICPIQVTQDLIIVDGHRRYQAAREVGIIEDHVIVRMDLDDEWSIQEALIECNRHRDRSTEVKLHEAQVLESIKQERLRERELVAGRREAVAVGLTEYEPFKFSPYQWEYDP